MTEPVLENLTERLVNRLGGTARADAVFGEAVTRGDVTVIPVARVGWGVGYGPDGGNKGGGGGVGAVPLGYIEIKNGDTQFRPIRPSGALGVLTVLGGALVASLAVIGWAWGRPRK